ncbi:CTDP1 phosphatase, partial [Atractosteus spatula]|nr:CTDP1 phosphatase [Atractosteus spatula]
MEDPADSGGGTAALAGPSKQVTEIRCPAGARPLRLLEWKVKPGSYVNIDSVLALCAPLPVEREAGAEPQGPPSRSAEKKVKSDRAGVVRELCCQLGQVVSPGAILVRIEECSHPIVMKGLCAECGQDLTQTLYWTKRLLKMDKLMTSGVSCSPKLSEQQAEQLGREDQQRLHRNRKLVLMVDLDQTLIHTTEQNCQRMSNKGIFHFQLGRGEPMLHTRLRPHCKDFLEKIARLYELHVFTFGSRLYAHTIAGFLDPEKKLFSHRILSRDECIDPFSKTGNLRNLFPCGDSMVCIIDDREDVWKFAPNLITVKKYIYFQGTGDINAPPGSRETQMKRKAANHVSPPAENAEQAVPAVKELSAEEQSNGLRKRGRDRHGNKRGPAEEEQPSKVGGPKPAPKVTGGPGNDLDFDLSSDSASDSGAGNPSSSDSEDEEEEKRSWRKDKESGAAEPMGADEVKASGENHSGEDPLTGIRLSQEADSLGELGNGCPEKKEAETESQNSEQSGVTMGEESLDQSMEEEEEEEETDLDQDDHLIYLEEVLARIHTEYYAQYERFLRGECPDTPDIRKIVPELKSKSLAETNIVFSGLYPTNYPMERTREYYHAKALGANISRNLVLNPKDPNRTTHLIAARAGTEKVRQAQGCRHLHVVNPDWLWGCLERWESVEEQLYPLKEDYIRTPRSSSPAAFPDAQGACPTPVFHPTPIHPRTPAGPEVRTYDSVTGKLIRKGPQSSRPSPYAQASGPPVPLPAHGDQSSFRVVQPPLPQQEEEEEEEEEEASLGPSGDEEQPGPSRRKRQPSMSESMPLYTLCKEDLESMDKEVDDILGEESDNESEGGKEEKMEEESQQNPEGKRPDVPGTVTEESPKIPSSGEGSTPRGHKRKLQEAKEGDDDSGSESSKASSNEDEEGSSSEADKMAAALEAELNDFM